jgi:NAD(P)H-nitrite reductase large subunit
MLKLGEKGAIAQRDGQTYAVAPHIPCGVVTPELLRKLADVAEKYGAKALKITGATRIAIVGLKEEDIDAVWKDLGMSAGAAVGLCVRSIRACPGTTFCKLGKQDALGIGLKLDERYHGFELPGKLKMSVSGCNLSCAESWVRDIGLTGYEDGWMLSVGGNVGAQPRIGKEMTKGLNDDHALAMVDKVLQYYKTNAKKGERLGALINRVGVDVLKAAVS